MFAQQISRQNHYVPIWYQKGFLRGAQSQFWHLDMHPEPIATPEGPRARRPDPRPRAPSSCFCALDLYVTRFGPIVNDEVERFFFGRIDNDGARAARAFANADMRGMHDGFRAFFEYLNAQKLRTPKGLDWIKGQYPRLSQIELMIELQQLRHMHSTMWVEGVREIVSAERSPVKFLLTDHPVAAYSSACAPTSSACAYPKEPSVAWKGTLTLFALDADHCLILTNLEYAQRPDSVDLTEPRTNARFAGQPLARTDAMIRTRYLTADEVTAVNVALKAAAKRYVASSQREALYPENQFCGTWPQIARVLLPGDQLWQFGGEVYVGFKDGSTHYQDAFGRTTKAHEFLCKTPPTGPLAPNDHCGCASGHRYKHCCARVLSDDHPPWDTYSIRERNLGLIRALDDVLGLARGATWDDVRRDLSDEQVKRVHEVLHFFWPAETKLAELLPRPNSKILRALYLGSIDPRTISASVIGWLVHFDEVVIVNPFPNPGFMRPEFSPIHSPAQHKSQFLKNAALLLTLQPFIDAGLVHLVPDPMEIDAAFRETVLPMAEARRGSVNLDDGDKRFVEALARDEFERATWRMPDDSLRRMILKAQPDTTPDMVERVLAHMKKRRAADPFSLLQPLQPGEGRGDLLMMKGLSLESALYLAHLTGSSIYCDSSMFWNQLIQHAAQSSSAAQMPELAIIDEAVARVDWEIELNELATLEMRQSGQRSPASLVLRRIWKSLTAGGPAALTQHSKDIARRIQVSADRTLEMWRHCKIDHHPSARARYRIRIAIPADGFGMTAVHRLLVTFGRTGRTAAIPLALCLQPLSIEERSAEPG